MSGSSPSTTCFVRDPGLRLVMVAGADATVFLNAQSMTPLDARDENECFACGFADNTGRVIAIATAWRRGESWQLLLPADQAAWLVSHLERYRFRSRCDIEVLAEYDLMAVFGRGASDALLKADAPAPAPGHAGGGELLCSVALSEDRYVVLGSNGSGQHVADALQTACRETDFGRWRGACMRAGEVAVYAATRGQFLPQMLNLEEAGVVGWNKGCYPGQEVIARLQHRGTVKKRLLLIGRSLDAAIGERAEVGGIPVEIVDRGVLQDGRGVTQVVAPYPFDAAIEKLRPE